MTRPPVARIPLRKPRRLTFSMTVWRAVMSGSCGSRLDGGGDPLIAAAAANVAAHRVVDLALGRVLCRRQQHRGLHDLAGLAITALRDVQGAPSLLHRVIAIAVEPLDRDHRAPVDVAYGGDAGTGGLAIDVHRASAAQRHAAAVFRSGEPQLVAQVPEQRDRWIAIEGLQLAVDL